MRLLWYNKPTYKIKLKRKRVEIMASLPIVIKYLIGYIVVYISISSILSLVMLHPDSKNTPNNNINNFNFRSYCIFI